MSLQTYNKPVFYDSRVVEYNADTGVMGGLTALTEKKGMAMEFQLNLKVLVGRDKYRIAPTNFTIVGEKTDGIKGEEDIAKGLYGLIEAGTRYASNIAKMSKGVIVGFFAKLGKYRQDEMPINVPSGDNSWATMVLNNSLTSGYASNPCTRNSALPATPASTAIRIPYFRDDFSRQDIKTDLDEWEYQDAFSGFSFQVGQVKFKDLDQIEMLAIPTPAVHSIKVAERSRNLGQLHINNDAHLGIEQDKVLSEAFNSFEDHGVDDDSIGDGGSTTTNP